jgi:Ricin-type beta-trefoil lectin domain
MKNKLAMISFSTIIAFSSTVLTVSAQSASALSLQSAVTGLCLDSEQAKLVGIKVAQGNVYTKPCKGNNPYQKWDLSQSGSSIILKHFKTGFCLTHGSVQHASSSYGLITKPCDGRAEQKWNFTSNRTPNDHRSDGTYKNEATGLCLDSNQNGQVYTMGCENRRTGQNWSTR